MRNRYRPWFAAPVEPLIPPPDPEMDGPEPDWFAGMAAYMRAISPVCNNCGEERVDILRHRCPKPYTFTPTGGRT